MMMVTCDLVQFGDIEQLCKLIKMEHHLVLAVLAKERNILTEIHIFQVIGDETTITALNALAKFFENMLIGFHLLYHATFRFFDKAGE